MSHNSAEVVQNNKVIGFIEWNATVEQLDSCQIWDTLDEVSEHWRKGDWKECTCAGPHEDAFLFEGYWHWPVRICPHCRVIITNRTLEEVFETYTCGTCGKEMRQCFDRSHKMQWPRHGHPSESRNNRQNLAAGTITSETGPGA